MTGWLHRLLGQRQLLLVLFAIFLAPLDASRCEAGGGPENVFLVVNKNSQDSITVANHYIDIRDIPPGNVFYLDWKRRVTSTTGKLFRDEILLPIRKEISNRGLEKQIDYIVYSCDFPWVVEFKDLFPESFPPQVPPRASLTGATYLYAFVEDMRKEMFSLNNNFYCGDQVAGVTVSRGFRSSYRWSIGGKRAGDHGLPYMLSAMLGVTYGKGNTVQEIAWYLDRASKADETAPRGTIYYVKNNSPRSVPRHNDFPAAVRELSVLGVRGQVLEGKFLENKSDVAGMTTGFHQLQVASSGIRILPGAFCDNLTSAGGQFWKPKDPSSPGQTCVSEFLRVGAAGACGTVVEPYAIAQKFPKATLHVHYVKGCSMAEAFYQSVAGPFQQILVGDPLCQPWAKFPEVELDGLAEGSFVKGTLEFTARVKDAQNPIAKYQLFVGGKLQQERGPGGEFKLDTTELEDGFQQVAVVAVENTPVETQGRWTGMVNVKNGRDALQLSVDDSNRGAGSTHLVIQVASTASVPVNVYHNGQELGNVTGGNGNLRVAREKLGRGPITLVARSEGDTQLRSRPLRVELN